MKRPLLLTNLHAFFDGRFQHCSIRISDGTITAIGSSLHRDGHDVVLECDEMHVVPGLINSHDHLELNVFPKLGTPPYPNYVEWGNDLQKQYKSEIRRILKVSLRDRLLWGAYKNIFSGVTTVVHHNPYYLHFRFGFPLEVYRNYSWAHSLSFDPKPPRTLSHSGNKVFVMHLAEGIDSLARNEFNEFHNRGGLHAKSVIVHGVALTPADGIKMAEAGTGLVWCPGSNLYLFGTTTLVESMPEALPIAIGTDSTLTGHASLFEEVCEARRVKGIAPRRLLEMVTTIPAKMFRLRSGRIAEGAPADLLLFDGASPDSLTDFTELNAGRISLLLKGGRPLYGEWDWLRRLGLRNGFEHLSVGGRNKFILGSFHALARRIRHLLPEFDFNGLPVEVGTPYITALNGKVNRS